MQPASIVRLQIETALARRIPSALSPRQRIIRPVVPTGVDTVDEMLDGGLPVGAITEMVGPESSGRTSLALSYLARITRKGSVCAWIDLCDALQVESAAAAGIDLSRLLWVRCGIVDEPNHAIGHHFSLPDQCLDPPPVKQGLHSWGFGSHPRNETKGLSDAISDLLKPEAIRARGAEPQLRKKPERTAVEPNLRPRAQKIKGRHIKVVPSGEEADALASLPLTVIKLTEEQAETFSLWGIHTLGELASLPEKELIARIGQRGKDLRQLACGEMPHLFQPEEPAFSLEERMELDSPLELLDALMFVVNVMLEQLILRATTRVLALASITIRLTLEGGSIHTRTVRPAQPSNERQIWIRLLHLDLEAHPPQAEILTVALEAEPGSTSKIQLGLFSPQLPESSRLDVTLARLRALVGDGNVGTPVLTDTNRMDGFRIEHFRVPTVQPSDIFSKRLRPAMRMLRPAEMIFVTLQSQRPKAFTFRDHRYSVEHAYGPWLTSGEWWTSTIWGCEQWDLVARGQNGCLLCCCLMRDRMLDDWGMIALYD